MLESVLNYFGNTSFVLVLAIFFVFLAKHRSETVAKLLMIACILFAVFYPIAYYLCKQVGLQEEAYRLWWLFPLSIIWAFGMVTIWQKYQFRMVTGIMLVIMTIAVLGSTLLNSSTWQVISNRYALEDDIIEIADTIAQKEGDASARVIGEPLVMMQIRQYSGKVQWAYSGRDVMIWAQSRDIDSDHSDDAQYRLAMAIQQGVYIDENALLDDMKLLQVQYVILSKDNEFVDHLPQSVCKKVKSAEKYNLYQMDYSVSALQDISVDVKKIVVPGLNQTYRFAVVNDIHIVSAKDIENPRNDTEALQQRYDVFTVQGHSSSDTWNMIYPQLDSLNCDAILFNGDMLDYYSENNFSILKEGLDRIQTPHFYLRADHDVMPFWCEEMDEALIADAQMQLDQNPDVPVLDYGEFIVMGINMNTSQISDTALQQIEDVFCLNKPIVVVAHVPFDSVVDNDLANVSKEAWQDRVLLWGNKEEDCYIPDDNTGRFLELLYADDSPVVAVVGAHLHFAHESMLTDRIPEYVFDASYKGTIGLLEISGEDNEYAQ